MRYLPQTATWKGFLGVFVGAMVNDVYIGMYKWHKARQNSNKRINRESDTSKASWSRNEGRTKWDDKYRGNKRGRLFPYPVKTA
jgi:hypothetical protein